MSAILMCSLFNVLTKTKLLQNCVKNDPCDVIKMRELRGEVGKKTYKKEMDGHSFLWLQMDDF